ncbi:MAG: hypothetical protein DWQ04_19780 [Chloroflexi bacterium]|nr:MAG: hypothetical protein DWQ04_19780 [Chloroflexota bacterium]
MARKTDHQQLDNLREVIMENPDQKAGWFAQKLGRDNKSVIRSLPQLENRGDLLMEDDNGRIRWFGRRK